MIPLIQTTPKIKQRKSSKCSENSKIWRCMSSCNDLRDVRRKNRLKRVLTKKEMVTTTSGTTSFYKINKLGRWGLLVCTGVILRLILALQRQIDLRENIKLLFVSIFREVAARKEWIAGTTIESPKLKIYPQLRQKTWEIFLGDQDTQLLKKIGLESVHLLKIVEFYALAE